MTPEEPRTCTVRAHVRKLPPSPLLNSMSIQLMIETGFVPDIVKDKLSKPRVRKRAGRRRI